MRAVSSYRKALLAPRVSKIHGVGLSESAKLKAQSANDKSRISKAYNSSPAPVPAGLRSTPACGLDELGSRLLVDCAEPVGF